MKSAIFIEYEMNNTEGRKLLILAEPEPDSDQKNNKILKLTIFYLLIDLFYKKFIFFAIS
jgi:hypothetical protein